MWIKVEDKYDKLKDDEKDEVLKLVEQLSKYLS